jgi:cyclopropane fatty-acyl-phospholipid synthase-like methyltransferase
MSTAAPQVTPEPIFDLVTGFMASKHLFTAGEIGLFEHLARGPATLEELAAETGVPARTLRIVTDAVVSLGLIERDGDRYSNSAAAAAFLSGNGPIDIRPLLRLANQLTYRRWMRFEEAVRTDERIFGELNFTEHEQAIFSKGVEAATAAHAQALASTYDFSQHHRLLDLGGGTGSFLLAALSRYPHLRATLFEQPAPAAVARERLKNEPLADQIDIVTGDFFSDPIPDRHDAVIIAHVLHCFTPDRNRALLRRLRQIVPDEARLLLVDFWTDSTHTEPRTAALMAGEFLLEVGGDVYSADEANSWLRDTGWQMQQHSPLAGPATLIVAEACRTGSQKGVHPCTHVS